MNKSMEKSNSEYLIGVLASAWTAFVTAPIVVKVSVFIGTFLMGLWLDLYPFVIGMGVFAGIDTHCAIKACIHNGGIYESDKVKKGLFVKFKLLFTLMIMTVIIDLLLHKIYNYEKYYMTYLLFVFSVIYEGGSIVESLNVTHPNNKLVSKFSSFLNLSEKKLNNKLDQ